MSEDWRTQAADRLLDFFNEKVDSGEETPTFEEAVVKFQQISQEEIAKTN
jgi:hypothetical protein